MIHLHKTTHVAGIQEKLGYFESLGVGALWLTPINPSPMKDNGYDVSDYKNVDPMFGTLEDFKASTSDDVTKVELKGLPIANITSRAFFKILKTHSETRRRNEGPRPEADP